MGAVDALGIGPMFGQDTVITSVDVANDQPITIVSRHGRRTWARTHPGVRGQVLDQPDAELLAIRLFGHLLAADNNP